MYVVPPMSIRTQASINFSDMLVAVQELHKSEFGSHFLVIYHDLDTFRELYSHYAKAALKDNEIVVILPFYETVNNVRSILSEDSACIDVEKYEKEQSLLIIDSTSIHALSEDSACIDVGKYEKEQSLLIIDSLKSYFGSQEGLMPFVKKIVEFAKVSGRGGVSVIGDMGPFFYYGKNDGLLHYETTTLPTRFEGINLKGICTYHRQDFKNFSEKEKGMLLNHHGKTLYLSPFLI